MSVFKFDYLGNDASYKKIVFYVSTSFFVYNLSYTTSYGTLCILTISCN